MKSKKRKKDDESKKIKVQNIISLGGWCGPKVGIDNLRKEENKKLVIKSLPFNYIRSKMEGINEILLGNRKVFFKKDINTEFTHFKKLTETELLDTFNRRIDRFITKIKSKDDFIFGRTIIHPDYKKELKEIKRFSNILKNRYNYKNPKILVIFHDQGIGTCRFKSPYKNIMFFAVEGKVGWRFHKTPENANVYYHQIWEYAIIRKNWEKNCKREHVILNHKSWGLCKDLYFEKKFGYDDEI